MASSNRENNNLEQFINDTFPVGPLEAPRADVPREIQSILIDEHCSAIRKLNLGRTAIIGRKGAGKTSVLRSSFLFDRTAITVLFDDLETANILHEIVELVGELTGSGALVEQVADLWEFILVSVAMRDTSDRIQNAAVDNFIQALSPMDRAGSTLEIALKHLEAVKKRTVLDHSYEIPRIRFQKIGDWTFVEAKKALTDSLISMKKTMYLCIDSLENYRFDVNVHANAIAGLLKFLGQYTAQDGRIIVRCCIPAEKYFDFHAVSSNPLKDFQGQILLRWDANELMTITAKRYARYLDMYHRDVANNINRSLNLELSSDAKRFWETIFPKTLRNARGIKENSIAYIVRHTQLLPRHIIHILNNILSSSIEAHEVINVQNERIVQGVRTAEADIASQIISAYSASTTKSPNLNALVRSVLRDLPGRFNWDQFEQHFAQRRVEIRSIHGFENIERSEIIKMFVEMGIFGKQITELTRYYIAIYEYMVPSRLVPTHSDTFCVHPIFLCHFGVNCDYPEAKPIYPYWSQVVPDELLDA